MKFPASTSTSFDDLLTIKYGQSFVLRGYEFIAIGDATHTKHEGIEAVSIPANQKVGSGWIETNVKEGRAYIAPLNEILGDL